MIILYKCLNKLHNLRPQGSILMAETTDKNASYVRTTALTEHESKSNSQEPRPGGFQGSTMKWFTGCVMWDKLQHEKSVRCGGGRGGLLEAESERWSAPELYDVWVPGCEARAALSTWDFKTKGQIWAPQQRDSDGWRVAVTWACSQRGEVKKMIDHHAMGESGEGLHEELSDCWSKMEPSVKVKQSHHSIPPVPWFQDHLLTWAKVWYSLILKFPNSRLLHFCTSVFSTTKHSRRPIFKDSKKHSQLSTWDLHRVLFS